MKFPNCGLSNIFHSKKEEILTVQYAKSVCDIDRVAEIITEMLARNCLSQEQIAAFCFTQYVKANIDKLCKLLKLPLNKCPYIGDKMGYTGASSPFIAFNSMLEKNRIKRGDYIIFWTIGAGMQHAFMLIKY